MMATGIAPAAQIINSLHHGHNGPASTPDHHSGRDSIVNNETRRLNLQAYLANIDK